MFCPSLFSYGGWNAPAESKKIATGGELRVREGHEYFVCPSLNSAPCLRWGGGRTLHPAAKFTNEDVSFVLVTLVNWCSFRAKGSARTKKLAPANWTRILWIILWFVKNCALVVCCLRFLSWKIKSRSLYTLEQAFYIIPVVCLDWITARISFRDPSPLKKMSKPWIHGTIAKSYLVCFWAVDIFCLDCFIPVGVAPIFTAIVNRLLSHPLKPSCWLYFLHNHIHSQLSNYCDFLNTTCLTSFGFCMLPQVEGRAYGEDLTSWRARQEKALTSGPPRSVILVPVEASWFHFAEPRRSEP